MNSKYWYGGRMRYKRQGVTAAGSISRTAHEATGGLPARGSGGENRRLVTQGYQPSLYSRLRMASSSVIRFEPVTP